MNTLTPPDTDTDDDGAMDLFELVNMLVGVVMVATVVWLYCPESWKIQLRAWLWQLRAAYRQQRERQSVERHMRWELLQLISAIEGS